MRYLKSNMKLLIVLLICTLFLVTEAQVETIDLKNVELVVDDTEVRILRSDTSQIIVGGNETLYVLQSYDSTSANTTTVGTCFSNDGLACHSLAPTDPECSNFIRSVTSLDDNLLICGTNAQIPQCFLCDKNVENCNFTDNSGDVDNQACFTENIDGRNVFQRNKDENATSLIHGDNIYFGVRESRLNGDSMIGSIGSVVVPTATGAMTSQVRTRSDSDKAVRDADFVGVPFSRGDYVYFLYRETAVEYASLSGGQTQGAEITYSRIARVCSNDVGTLVGANMIWTSFQKQRLVCQELVTEDSNFYVQYDEIQDFEYETNETIHAIFTSARNGEAASALCTFNMSDIDITFSTGDFFGSDTAVSQDLWRVYDGSIVTPRPGFDCSSPNTADTNFERDFVLMKPDAVSNATVWQDVHFFAMEMNEEEYILTGADSCVHVVQKDLSKTDMGCLDQETTIKDFSANPDMVLGDKLTIFAETENGVNRLELEVFAVIPPTPHPTTFTVAPNAIFTTVLQLANYEIRFDVGNEAVLNETELKLYLVEEETLDNDTTPVITRLSIRILYDTTIAAGGADIITISTYEGITDFENATRYEEWNKYFATTIALNTNETCLDAGMGSPGAFNTTIITDLEENKSCASCTYSDCGDDNFTNE